MINQQSEGSRIFVLNTIRIGFLHCMMFYVYFSYLLLFTYHEQDPLKNSMRTSDGYLNPSRRDLTETRRAGLNEFLVETEESYREIRRSHNCHTKIKTSTRSEIGRSHIVYKNPGKYCTKKNKEGNDFSNRWRRSEALKRERGGKEENSQQFRVGDTRSSTMEETIESNTTTTMWKRPWEDLPHHLLELFLKPISEPIDRPNLSRVCKAWQDFKPLQSSCFPELVHGSIVFNRVLREDEYLLRSCVGSSHGWLIIRMRKIINGDDVHLKEFYYLLNIFTKDTIQLPILWNVTPVYPKMYLSSAPTDPDCIVLMFDASFRGFLFSKRGCNKWIESECEYPLYSKPLDTKDYNIYTAILFEGGKFYALSFRGNLVAIDIINVNVNTVVAPTATLTVLPVNKRVSPTRPTRVGYDWFLIESLGKLLRVLLYRCETDKKIVNLDVLQLDFKTMSWVTVKSLPGDQVLFIGMCGSFSISGSEIGINSSSGSSSSSSGRGGNCIYVIDDALGKVHRYDVHNQEMMVCTGYPTCEAFDNYRRFWVRPTSV